MTERIDVSRICPNAHQAMGALQHFVEHSSLARELLALVDMRASEINGCAFCLDMHSKDALALGIPQEKLFLLNAWREAPIYSEDERAALQWTEVVTLVAESGVPDEAYEEVRQRFSEQQVVELTMAIIAINGWNRLEISVRRPPGHYQSRYAKHTVER